MKLPTVNAIDILEDSFWMIWRGNATVYEAVFENLLEVLFMVVDSQMKRHLATKISGRLKDKSGDGGKFDG